MIAQIIEVLGLEDLSGVPPDIQFLVSAFFTLFLLSEILRLMRTVLYRIFGGDK